MKLLKPIVASMILAGVTFPAFAADDTQAQLDSMKAQLAKMEAVIKQNQSGGFGQTQDWFKRITISGLVNADGYMSNKSFTSSRSSNALVLNNANLFVDAAINEWTNGHLAFLYQDNNATFNLHKSKFGNNDVLDEAYVTVGNFAKSPVYFRAGRQYLPFGTYDRFPLVVNPTQLLTETSATAVQLGFVLPSGFYGSVYGLQGLRQAGDFRFDEESGKTDQRQKVRNGGANLGYAYNTDQMGFRIDVGYINNMADVDYITNGMSGQYTDRVGGLSAGIDFRYTMFDFGARYVKALKRFNSSDIDATAYDSSTHGIEPAAYGLTAGITFPVMAHQSRFGLGYQHSNDSANIGINGAGLPQNRYYGEYMVNISKWTDIGLAVVHDRHYNASIMNGGSSTTGIARLSVKFA